MEPIITIPGQENTDVATLTPMQEAIVPHVPAILVFWWAVWIATFLYIAGRYFVLPLFKK